MIKWRCPICRKPTDSETDRNFPFCSERCRVSDLGSWATGQYRISEPAFDLEAAEFPRKEEDEDEL
jgi:endogenous inhibitor of DNA gyrase (YacG/DUF329 family)